MLPQCTQVLSPSTIVDDDGDDAQSDSGEAVRIVSYVGPIGEMRFLVQFSLCSFFSHLSAAVEQPESSACSVSFSFHEICCYAHNIHASKIVVFIVLVCPSLDELYRL